MFRYTKSRLPNWMSKLDDIRGKSKRGGRVHSKSLFGSGGHIKRWSKNHGIRDGIPSDENWTKGALGLKSLGGCGLYGSRRPAHQGLSIWSREQIDFVTYGQPNICNRLSAEKNPFIQEVASVPAFLVDVVMFAPSTSTTSSSSSSGKIDPCVILGHDEKNGSLLSNSIRSFTVVTGNHAEATNQQFDFTSNKMMPVVPVKPERGDYKNCKQQRGGSGFVPALRQLVQQRDTDRQTSLKLIVIADGSRDASIASTVEVIKWYYHISDPRSHFVDRVGHQKRRVSTVLSIVKDLQEMRPPMWHAIRKMGFQLVREDPAAVLKQLQDFAQRK